MIRALLAALLAVAVLATASPAAARVERFAVLVGNDHGDDRDGPLRYAVTDAERMRDVLTQLGSVPATNLVVLRDENADTVRRALIAMNDRVRTAVGMPGVEVMLFVYYSGHADASALHLGRSRLDLAELQQVVRGSSAQFRLLLIDACRSGAITRVKGGTRAPPFSIRIGDHLDGQGVVFLTSSASGEDSQESDDIGGSFFTHYFASGLRGAADTDGDGKIELDEAYRYAYDATVRATSRTWAGTQHPAFRFDLGGQGRVVLTEPRSAQSAALLFPGGRSYLVLLDSSSGAVVAELTEGSGARTIYLRPGTYFVRGRAENALLEGTVSAVEGQTVAVRDEELHRTAYARLVRKGGTSRTVADGPIAGYTFRTALRSEGAACHGAFVGYAFTFSALSITPRIDACFSGFDSVHVHAAARDTGADVRVAHVWDLPFLSVDLGLTLGASLLHQTFTTTGYAPPRTSFAGRGSVSAGLTREIAWGVYLNGDGAAETYLYALQDATTGTTSTTPSLAFRLHLGVGKDF